MRKTQGVVALKNFWLEKEPDFIAKVIENHLDTNGLWGNCHSPLCTPASQSILERVGCKGLKDMVRKFALVVKSKPGLPLRMGVGIEILFDDAIPKISREVNIPRQPKVVDKHIATAKSIFKSQQKFNIDKSDFGMYFLCENSDLDIVKKAAIEDLQKCEKIIREGITNLTEMILLAAMRIFNTDTC